MQPKLLVYSYILLTAGIIFFSGCIDRKPAPVCPVPTEIVDDEAAVNTFDGLDLLLVVDNSSSMAEEQEILASAVFSLVNSLTAPLPGWDYDAADNVRVAVVSSDMGLSWGGNPYVNGDGWPDEVPNETTKTSSVGDNGAFQVYSDDKVVNLQDNKIPCDATNTQCPTGWICDSIDSESGIGACSSTGGTTSVTCPSLSGLFAETSIENPNDLIAFNVSCLSSLGTDGFGFEQQLQSAKMGLSRNDQQFFIRDNALLAVIVVSDEEDCSIESNELFATSEIQNAGEKKINLACGNNSQFLYSPKHYYDQFVELKGNSSSVVFAAIVGVPQGTQYGCEGTGNQLEQCLEQSEMQAVPYFDAVKDMWLFSPACQRFEYNSTLDQDEEITSAIPGRRYVDLAQDFGEQSYVYSICNEDWSPAMSDIAKLIAKSIGGTCYGKPLDYDLEKRMAKCSVIVEFSDTESCPEGFDPNLAQKVERVDSGGAAHIDMLCELNQLPASKDCSEIDPESLQDFGWYYCENPDDESFADACLDGVDNDNDGFTDCGGDGLDPDSDCFGCCEDTEGECSTGKCKYQVQLTDDAMLTIKNNAVFVQCLQQFSFEDPNCQENTLGSCNNDEDDDGNGVWDCDDSLDGENSHYADPNCCPMDVVDGKCVVKSHENCDGSTDANPSDACREAARRQACSPPW